MDWGKLRIWSPEVDTENTTLVIFGAGGMGKNVNKRISASKVLFCDNNDELHNKYSDGVRVISVDEAARLQRVKYLIPVSDYMQEMKNQLLALGVNENEVFSVFPSILPLKKLQFEIQLVEHCNLMCKYCSHLSPLAEKEFISLNTITKDFARVAELTGGDIERLYLLGGEPLLHPELEEICRLARLFFPKGDISIITKGILLETQEESLWKTCSQNKISIEVTEYPLKINYDGIIEKIKDYEVDIKVYREVKGFEYQPLDSRGGNDMKESFCYCGAANNCILLANGRMYPCSYPSNIRHLNRHFDSGITENNSDSIDIYEVNDVTELLNGLANPIHFCRYCSVGKRKNNVKWERSNLEYSEWLLNNVKN